ncbi:hypothetical protein AB0N38_26430 [Micromonospora aurantiaca]|uniref:hypothetical protein n=1 Tax=Micromonospora aurantiaca (nom. illeg.) TaxID=47850 RepID=UPI00342B93F9
MSAPTTVRPARVTDLYREAHASDDPALLLRAAIIAMAVRYARSSGNHGFACGAGTHAERVRHSRAEKRRRLALERLTAALVALAGGTW